MANLNLGPSELAPVLVNLIDKGLIQAIQIQTLIEGLGCAGGLLIYRTSRHIGCYLMGFLVGPRLNDMVLIILGLILWIIQLFLGDIQHGFRAAEAIILPDSLNHIPSGKEGQAEDDNNRH